MTVEDLKNKPLVEAIFELRWRLTEPAKGVFIDPHYKLLVGRLYDKISDQYPKHQALPSASMPDEISAYVVQHQFKQETTTWPLVQVGPGVITLNDTASYTWSDFRTRIKTITDGLISVYPKSETGLKVSQVLLRYIDAEEFDFDNDDIWSFLADKMKIKLEIFNALFGSTGVSHLPLAFDLKFTFPSTSPQGAAHLRLARGTKNGKDSLIWETQLQSVNEDVPENVIDWVDAAHVITDDWFFKMIDGDLLEKYK